VKIDLLAALPGAGSCDKLSGMETSHKTFLLHDDRVAQMLLERIREKKLREQEAREKSLEPNLNEKQSLN
jgi:hypothetical protein